MKSDTFPGSAVRPKHIYHPRNQGLPQATMEITKSGEELRLSCVQALSRSLLTAFLRKFIRIGQVQIHELGGARLIQFDGVESLQTCKFKSTLRILSPDFYWKVVARQDLGLADAYIDGDLEFVGDDGGPGGELLINFLLTLVANRDIVEAKWWWSPFTAVGSATSYVRHVLHHNSLTNARRNISRHYDLSNAMFSFFLDQNMHYSCAIFEGDESLSDAQMRKVNLIIDKGKVESSHDVLDIGCGWGAFAIQLVRRTGCNYTGITLSQAQLDYAQAATRAAGLEHKITIQLLDYRAVAGHKRFDRIFSVEMLEHVGHEYLRVWFQCCDRLLAKDGLLVLQFTSMADGKYDVYRRSSDFVREYIFPGGCLPALSTVTAAMASGSSLCVQHVENIGPHNYFKTLLQWQRNFRKNRSDIVKLGFGESFIRMWEYYFCYAAVGFKSCGLRVYQMVFSQPTHASICVLHSTYESSSSKIC